MTAVPIHPSTPVSLLERLRREPRTEDWERFVELYSPILFSWARRFGLDPDSAAELVQEVIAHLLRKVPELVYDPQKRFRNWLRTVFLNKARAIG